MATKPTNEADPIAIFLIATGKYICFAPSWITSVARFFLPDRPLRIVVFTDHDATCMGPNFSESLPDRVILLWKHQPHLPWPDIALERYQILIEAFPDVETCSHLFYLDADMRLVAPIGEEILTGGIVATIHPGFWDQPKEAFTYERRPESSACIPSDAGSVYFISAFHGGEIFAYQSAFRTLAARTQADRDKNIVAVWHDESHWNRYLAENPPTISLHPGHCYPEGWSLPFPRIIEAVSKNHQEMRS